MNEENIQQISESTNELSNWSLQLLQNLGLGATTATYLNIILLLIVLTGLVFVLQYLTRTILRQILTRFGNISGAEILKDLSNRRFPHFLAMVIPYSLVKGSIPIIFDQFPKSMAFINKLVDIFLIFYVIWLLMSVINAFFDMLARKPRMKDKPLQSYAQVIKIVLYCIGLIILFSILTGQDPKHILTGLGALSAVLMLVFKDPILGFVASIQVSANDMVRIGDWITMPKYDADGDVFEISLTTVKIRNFDKTITTIPPYSLVSESFQNWRGMVETGGRRLKRSVFVKQSTIRFLSDEEVSALDKIGLITDYIRERKQEIDTDNQQKGIDKSLYINGRNLTNMGLYRQYLHSYLKNHPDVHQELLILVRQLQPTSKGLPLELYFFTATTQWLRYEAICSDILDHVAAAAKYFDLELFEDVSNPIIAGKATTMVD